MTEFRDEESRIEIARKRVREKLGFLKHFLTYIVVIAFLAVVNNTTWGGYQWWIWPALGWGVGIISHFFSAFLFRGSAFEDRLLERELKNMDDK